MGKMKDDVSKVRLEIDGKQAINQLGKLEMESKELRVDLKNIKDEQAVWIKESKNLDKLNERFQKLVEKARALKGENKQNTKTYQNNQKAIEKVALELKKAQAANDKLKDSQVRYNQESEKLGGVKNKIDELRKTLGLTGMTMSQLIRHQRELRKEMSTGTTRGTAAYEELRSKLVQVNQVIAAQNSEMNKGSGFFSNIGTEVSKLAGAMGIFMGATGIVHGLKALIGVSAEFEQSMSNLSALTGATGDELQQLEDAAMRIGGATTLSAQQTADAFTIIASKKPELLENTDALIATTEASITLAEAAGIELPAAADALTNTLNQFGVGAEEAERYINVLAAGSKFGAGNIEFLNDSIKRFGPIAASMEISIEQSAAMMEIFAEKGIESEKAGTQFRNILLKLATGADEFNPSIVGMEKAIENLSNANLSATEKVKLFGVENFLAGEILLASGERFTEMTDKLTGTDVALEQAGVRVDNFAGDLKGLTSVSQEYAIRLGELITNGLRPFIQGTTAMMHALKATPQFIRENKDLFIAFGAALIAFNTAQIASTALKIKDTAVTYYKIVADKAAILSTITLTGVTHALNAAFTANPIGMVVKAAALLIGGFTILYNRSEKVRAAIAGIGAVAGEVWQIVKETFGQFIGGFQKILDGDWKEGLKDIGKGFFTTLTFGTAEGERLAGAFTKGFKNKIDSEKDTVQESLTDLTTGPIIPIDDNTGEGDGTGRGGGGGTDQLKQKLDSYAKEWEAYQKKLREISRQYALLDLPEQEREIEVNRQKYRDLEEELITFYENKVITTAEFEDKLREIEEKRLIDVDAIKEKFRLKEEEDKQKALDKVQNEIQPLLDSQLSDDQFKANVIDKTNEHFDQLVAIAQENGMETVSIEEARRIKLAQIQDEYDRKALEAEQSLVDAKINLAFQLSSALGAAINFIGNKSGELTAFQKILTGAQIAIDLAAGLGKVVPLAMAAASKDGPLAAFTLAGYIASMTGMVFTAIGKATQALGGADTPQWSGSSEKTPAPSRARSSQNRKSFFFGGATSEGMGFGDQYGEFAGMVHKHEYVIPQMVTSEPWVANLLPAIESIRQDRIRGFAQGGATSGNMSNSNPMSTERLENLMLEMLKEMKMQKKSMRAYLVYNDLEEMQEEMDTLKSRYRA